MHIYMPPNSIFFTIFSKKMPLEISYFLGLKITFMGIGSPFLKVLMPVHDFKCLLFTLTN